MNDGAAAPACAPSAPPSPLTQPSTQESHLVPAILDKLLRIGEGKILRQLEAISRPSTPSRTTSSR